MSYTEHIGTVVGKNGTTYIPQDPQIIENQNKIKFTFINEEDENDVIESLVSFPLIEPIITNDNHLTFRYVYGNPNNVDIDIDNDLVGPKGDTGAINITTIDIDDYGDISISKDGYFETRYDSELSDSTLYVLRSRLNPSLNGDTYIISHQDTTATEWTRITDFIQIENYVLKSEFETLQNQINEERQCIANQQNEIKKILRSGIDVQIEPDVINPEELELNLKCVNVIWDDDSGSHGPMTMYDFIIQIVTQIEGINND